jgi:ATP-binding cassette subfamily F protein 3
VFVSHDRYFIDKLATRVFEIEGGKLEDFPGNYEDYLWQKERRASGEAFAAGNGQPASAAATGKSAPAKKTNPMVIRKMEERREELEAKIASCEKEINTYELELANFKSAEESKRVAALLNEHRTRLAKMTKDWEGLAATLEGSRRS